jgi:hypothetical protein
MACNGYDPKAVKVPKAIKRVAVTIGNAHERGEFIRRYVNAIRANAAFRSAKAKKSEE